MNATVLGLRLSERRHAWLATLALLVAYVATMARDLSLYDSPELALAAVMLGLGHPPGQPLHTLLGHAFSLLPVPALIAVGLASAVPGALCVIPASSIAERLAGDAIDPKLRRTLPWLLAALGLLPSLWEISTRVEVYALATVLGLWTIARLAPLDITSRDVFAAALVLGLCASVNPMIALLVGLAVAPAIVVLLVRRALPLRAVPLSVLGGVLGLLPYAYVPLVAQRTDVLIWGAPRDAASLRAFFTLADYDPNHQLTLAMWIDHFIAFFPHAAGRGLMALIAVGVFAHVALRARTALGSWTGPLLLALMIGQISFNVTWNLDVLDYDGYLASALWLLAAGAAAGCVVLYASARRGAAVLVTALVVLSAWIAPPPVVARTRHRDRVARALTERVLAEAPRGAIVISTLDLFSASLLYLQEVERQRPDVVVLIHGLASSSWHWEHIYRRHPDLMSFSLRGPGGRDARVARFLAANPERAVRVERLAVAEAVGVRACPGGLYLRAGAACDSPADPAQLAAASALLAQQLASIGDGSPAADAAVADVSAQLGYALWRLGEAKHGYLALLAGVPDALEPRAASDVRGLERAPTGAARLPSWRRHAALGDAARNLYLAGMLAGASGRVELAAELVAASAGLGLPEAVDLVSAAR